jgi:ribosomal-protein-serine acetyltransferase
MKTQFSDQTVGIRPYRHPDIPLLFEAVRESINELSAWLDWCTPAYSPKESTEFIVSQQAEGDKGADYNFVIYELQSGAFLGGVGLNQINRMHNFANLGYWVRTNAAGRGVATAAVRLMARLGLEELKFNRLEILASAGNAGSQRVAAKAGARREGLLRKRLLVHGQPHDAVLFSLVAKDLTSW